MANTVIATTLGGEPQTLDDVDTVGDVKSAMEVENHSAIWHYRTKGLERFLAKARSQPACQWMRLWHNVEQNVILGVKAEGKRFTETGWLEKICDNYVEIESR